MKRLWLPTVIVCAFLLAAVAAWAQEQPAPAVAASSGDLAGLQQQVEELRQRLSDYDQLKQRLDELEKKLAATEKKEPAVAPANKETKIKLDGRMFVGAFQTGKQGSFRNRSLDIPDAKLRLTIMPSKDITIVNRFSNSRAASGGFDYFYADINNWAGLAPGHTVRVGKFKIDVGQETWSDNPIESILISNSISHISGYDEGVNFRGPIPVRGMKLLPTYSVALMNASKGFSSSSNGLAWSAKVGAPVTPQLYVSGSYFKTGDLVKANGTLDQPDFNIAEVFDAPAGATAWQRSLWELDARYGYGKEGINSIVGAPVTARWQAGATYGQFTDSATGAGASDRQGKYWFVEGLYNLSRETYFATRYSEVSLDDDAVTRLGGISVPVNEYRRLSLGLGYRLTRLTHLKFEYSRNRTSGGASKPHLDQVGVGVATKF